MLCAAPSENPLLIGYFSPWPEGNFHAIRSEPKLDAEMVAQMPTYGGVWMYVDSICQIGVELWAKVAPPSTNELQVPDEKDGWMCLRNSEGRDWLVPANGVHEDGLL